MGDRTIKSVITWIVIGKSNREANNINVKFRNPLHDKMREVYKYKTEKKSLHSPAWDSRSQITAGVTSAQDSWIFIGQESTAPLVVVVVVVNSRCGASWTIIGRIIYHWMQQYFAIPGNGRPKKPDKLSLTNPFIYMQFPILVPA